MNTLKALYLIVRHAVLISGFVVILTAVLIFSANQLRMLRDYDAGIRTIVGPAITCLLWREQFQCLWNRSPEAEGEGQAPATAPGLGQPAGRSTHV